MAGILAFTGACTNTITVVPDFGARDFARASGDDLAMSGDLSTPADLSTPLDLAMSIDLAIPLDMTATIDMVPVVDMTPPPDLKPPIDMACNAALCTTPPPNGCMGGDTQLTYSAPGTCGATGCEYAPVMMSCTNGCYQGACSTLFLGNTKAYQTGTGNIVPLSGGTAPSSNSVSAVTQTYPMGSATAVHLIYSLNDPNFGAGNTTNAIMLADPPMVSNDQWYYIIPAQPAGTHVYWYMRADQASGPSSLDPHGAPTVKALDYTTN